MKISFLKLLSMTKKLVRDGGQKENFKMCMKKIIKNWVLPPSVHSLIVRFVFNARGYFSGNKKKFSLNKMSKGRHKGERCFILFPGSSIKLQDLKKLAGECVIAVSNSFVHPDYRIFRPKYHVLPPLVSSHSDMFSEEEFVAWLREMENKTLDAEMFFHIGDKRLIEKAGLFKNRIIHWNEYCPWNENDAISEIDLSCIPSIWSVSEYALSVAIYLGYSKIYLLGLDHDWFNGALVHFYDEKEHVLQPEKAKYETWLDSEFQMRRHIHIFRKYKALRVLHKEIYNANANPNSYVDVFAKVEYDLLFPRDSNIVVKANK